MIEAQEAHEERARTAGARADFVANLGRRLDALRGALAALEEEPRSLSRRNNLQRRIHAMGAAAHVLGFDSVAESLSGAEQALQRSLRGGATGAAELAEVSRVFDLLPSLAWGAPVTVRPPASTTETAVSGSAERTWPLSVLVFGGASLAKALEQDNDRDELETEQTEDPSQARQLARVLGPDVIVVDSDHRGARELVETLVHDPLVEPVPLVVTGSFEHPESASAYVGLGATRVLPKPASPDTLRRTVLEVSRQSALGRSVREPIGEVSVDALAERIASEVRRGLIDAVEPGGRGRGVPLGEGTDVLAAVWGAVARVRELVTLRSRGLVRFDPGGPEGAIPVAAWSSVERRDEERTGRGGQDLSSVSLKGRRFVVADDDPAVVWFMSGLLRAAGAEVLEAHDGKSALALARDGWPDAVISDVLMPGLDGFSLCHELKRDVAVRDIPVILLSWKEDLLQRVRELGADADAYLRKEATASQVVQRVREVLGPRARVEQRMAAGGEVRGRLDGLTPRLVLELACRIGKNVRVSVRDAAYLYEIEVRNGRLCCATRTASDGSFERGEVAIAALLGVSAGRFVVAPATDKARADFEGTLEQVLAGPIGRARAAQELLGAEALLDVERVEIDAPAMAGYLAGTPEPAQSLLQRLIDGASPREMLLRGEASARLLEGVLSDVARHAAVRRVVQSGGHELDTQTAPPAPVGGPHVEAALHAEPTPPPPHLAVAAFDPDASHEETPMFSFQLSPLPPAAGESAPESEGRLPPVMVPETVDDGWDAAPSPVPSPSGPVEGNLEESAPDLGAAVVGEVAEVERDSDTRSPAPVDASMEDEAPAGMQSAGADAGAGDDEPAAEASVATGAARSRAKPPPDAPIVVRKVVMPPRPRAEALAAEDADDEQSPPAQAAAEADEEPARSESGADEPRADEERADEERADAEVDHAPAEAPGAEVIPAPLPPRKKIEFPSRAARRDEAEPRREKLDSDHAAEAEARGARVEPELEPEGEMTPGPAAQTTPAAERPLGALRMALIAAAAGVVSFGAVRLITAPARNAASVPAAKVAPSAAQVAPSPGSAAAVHKASPPPVSVNVEDMPLPPGVPIAKDKGLLEVETGGRQVIYVDGVFVGHGPLRRIPLAPGDHEVKTKQDGQERVDHVTVAQGRRARLPLAKAWK